MLKVQPNKQVARTFAAVSSGNMSAADAAVAVNWPIWLHLATQQVSNKNCKTVVLNLFHCWDPLNATDVVWDPQVKIEKVCAPE